MLTLELLIMFLYYLYRRYNKLTYSEPVPVPSERWKGNEYNLTLDKLNAIDAQIDACHAVIRALEDEKKDAKTPYQLASINKRQSDLTFRISKLSIDADKLHEKIEKGG